MAKKDISAQLSVLKLSRTTDRDRDRDRGSGRKGKKEREKEKWRGNKLNLDASGFFTR